ncbi:acyltransferase family protein [Streptomyces sp. NPDC099088]|uniref:acyltransferase family protein n=1 Tax=Streptomyces sp. NPDC099088 TaxID=3366101 RepID=UPI003820A1CF
MVTLQWRNSRHGDALIEKTERADVFASTSREGYVSGLDGLRGLAALYVVLFHCSLLSFSGFPERSGPGWLGWLMYGRLAVVFFLVLSGFSLALSAAQSDWRLTGVWTYLQRRAWRILPPYWSALGLSIVVALYVVPASHLGPPTGKSIIVYGFILQDILKAPTPNGSFWSIGVEVELYLFFPFFLLVRRVCGPSGLVVVSAVLIFVAVLIAGGVSPAEGMNGLTLNLAPVFLAGLLGAGIVRASGKVRRLPWHWFSAFAAAPVLLLIVSKGSVWTVDHYFWIDLAVAPAMALLLVAITAGKPFYLVRVLVMRPIRVLGEYSYSLYLIHLPIVMIATRVIAPRWVSPGLPTFATALVVGVPGSLLCSWLFSTVFEVPFRRRRSWKSVLASIQTAVGDGRRD